MKRRTVKFLCLMLFALLIILAAGCQSKTGSKPQSQNQSAAQTKAQEQPKAPVSKYPEKPVEYIVHTNPGAGVDIMARTVTDIITKEKLVSQPVTVVNKPGGSGAVAFSYVYEKKGDPYILVGAQPTFITTLLKKGSFSATDFTPIGCLAAEESIVVVKTDSPYQSMKDLINAAKKAPKAISQGGGAIGGSNSIVNYLIEKAAGVDFNYVSFTSDGEVPPALLGGNVDFIVANPSEILGLIEAKKVRVLAVAADKRIEVLPDVPTLKEQGVDVEYRSFRGIAAPPGIPKEAVAYWEGVLEKVVKTEGWKKYLKDNNNTLLFMKSDQFGQFLKEQVKVYETTLREMGQLK